MYFLRKLNWLFIIALMFPVIAKANPDAEKFYFIAGTALIYPDLKYDDPPVIVDKKIPLLGRLLDDKQVTIPATDINVSDIALIGGSVGYQITEQFAVEAVVGLPGTIRFSGGGLLAPLGEFGEFEPGQFIPILLNAVYIPFPDWTYRPYVGIGPVLAWIRDTKVTNPLVDSAMSIEFPKMNWGWGVQTGVQINILDDWFMRLDAKYLWVYVDEVDIRIRALNQSLDIPISDAEMALPLISFGIGRVF